MACMRQSFRAGVVLDGRYKTLSYVHEGSFGMVFKARDLVTNDIVAIKCLTKRSVVDDAYAEFAIEDSEELALHERLGSHPNIVNLMTSFETDAHLYLVLEFCARGDLYEAIYHNTGPAETEKIRRLMLELIDAVEYIHSKGIYHRDIKPENIFLSDSGMVKLGDFGLSTTEEVSYENAVGSDRYMAPEQFESDGAGYSPAKADIWAIGICLLNILFKKNPFTKPTAEDAFFRDFCADHRSLFDIFDIMSEDTFEVLQYCLNLNPAKRSLEGARQALLHVDSFTTTCDDDDEDAFLCGSPRAQATANREPLGTPAIQSPAVEQDGWGDSQFWTKALHGTPPQPIRASKLNIVEGIGSYSEDLFAKSAESTDWCSADSIKSQSLASTLDSGRGTSAFNLTLPEKYQHKFTSNASVSVGSLPINMAKPKPVPSLSMIFGRKDCAAKSWSDMIEEDEEEESELYQKLNALKENNARTFSHDSVTDHHVKTKVEDHPDVDIPVLVGAPTKKMAVASHDISDKEDAADGLFMYEPPSPKRESPPPAQTQWPRYNPPTKRTTSSTMDKWTALGERRRAYAETPEKKQPRLQQQQPPSNKWQSPINTTSSGTSEFTRPRRTFGFSNYSFGTGNVDFHTSTSAHYHSNHYNFNRNRDHRTGQSREACPWTRRNDLGAFHREGGRGDCRDWNWRKDRRHNLGNIEWVGGCLEARS